MQNSQGPGDKQLLEAAVPSQRVSNSQDTVAPQFPPLQHGGYDLQWPHFILPPNMMNPMKLVSFDRVMYT